MRNTALRTLSTTATVIAATAALLGTVAPSASAATGDPYFCNATYRYFNSANAQHIPTYADAPYSYGFYTTECKLRKGDKGSGVKALQRSLKKCYKQNIAIDGSFGPATFTALKNAQKKLGLTADGVYGYNTSRAMNWPYFAPGGVLFACH
ncbi:peptidoglycan-binding domain-containing protein [Streptomyces sp. SID7909]|uniref:peptidoglycan-binding domain-containing protein n=1 Tax=Streptomyces sp. SID7909 TaxID=2706092 RepID=UPI0013BC1640|nr:peptidoglycan-binding domain-containing protein [Streptomyces sp. SID7909]NEC07489.1 peptidoglycan-binding protein [Streptomyces sp. SID7909]